MVLRKGSRGNNVKILQEFLEIEADGIFGGETENHVKKWQAKYGLEADGIVGSNTIKIMGLELKEEDLSVFDEKYKGVVIKGCRFPDKPIRTKLRVRLSDEIKAEYLPALQEAVRTERKGFKLLCTIMAHKEGYYKGTRSYRTNNPGNIGNTDSGRNRTNSTLTDGILLQKDYIYRIINDVHRAYPMGKEKFIKPYYSPEIARNYKNYGMSPYLPGYKFIFDGRIEQFVKIYSTGARGGNSYLSMIISYFNQNGIKITPESKIQDIIRMS
jgi:hypothetical protein